MGHVVVSSTIIIQYNKIGIIFICCLPHPISRFRCLYSFFLSHILQSSFLFSIFFTTPLKERNATSLHFTSVKSTRRYVLKILKSMSITHLVVGINSIHNHSCVALSVFTPFCSLNLVQQVTSM